MKSSHLKKLVLATALLALGGINHASAGRCAPSDTPTEETLNCTASDVTVPTIAEGTHSGIQAKFASVENHVIDTAAALPEPGAVTLLGGALVGLGLIPRRKKV
jgi:hypothetical protein